MTTSPLSSIWQPEQKLIVPNISSHLRSSNEDGMYGRPRSLYGILDLTRLKVDAMIDEQDVSPTPIIRNSHAEHSYGIDGKNYCILRYERNGFDVPASVLGFNSVDGAVKVNQIQGTRHKVAVKVYATLNIWTFYRALLEENFLKNGVPVFLNPYWIDNAEMASEGIKTQYMVFGKMLEDLCKKHGL